MSGLWLPLTAVVAAFALSYLFCMRPMRRRECMNTRPRRTDRPSELDQAIAEARAELAQLRNTSGPDPRSRDRQPEMGRSASSDR